MAATAPGPPLPHGRLGRRSARGRRHGPVSSTGAHPALHDPGLRCDHQRRVVDGGHAAAPGRGPPQTLLAPPAQERLDPLAVPRVGLDDGRQDVAHDGHQLDDEVDEPPRQHRHQHAGRQAAANPACGADQRDGVGEGHEVADDREQAPDRGGAELHVQPAAAVAVYPPLVAPGLLTDRLKDALVLVL